MVFSPFARLAVCALAAVCVGSPAAVAQSSSDEVSRPAAEAAIRPAIGGIFEAFASYPLVGLGEMHGVSQILEFYREIVRHPRFASEVGHVVVEFGGAAQQATIDRYVSGEDVPYEDLRRVWTDTVGQPAVNNADYALFFAQVRQTNLALPPEQRIRVWLGEPPIDWSQITTREQFLPILGARDTHAAKVITDNILAHGRKALVLYGGAHLVRTKPWEKEARALLVSAGLATPGGDANIRDLVEEEYPGSFFVAQTYQGFKDEACTASFEQRMASWPLPILAMTVRGTALEEVIRKCLAPRSMNRPLPPTVPAEVQERLRALIGANADRDHQLLADSIIFYAPADELTVAPYFPDLFLDEEWRAELSRRSEIINGRPLPPEWGRTFPSGPMPHTGRW